MASMDFLALAARAHKEAGLPGSGPASVLNQSGRLLDVVNAVLAAHEEIQELRKDWTFDWARGTFSLSAGDDTYDPTVDFGITGGVREFSRAPLASYVYPTASGVNARNFLKFKEWEEFRGLNVPVVNGNVPTIFTLQPDGNVVYYPKPTVACTVVHEYYRNPETLAADATVPRMPTKFHMAIVWKAVMLVCGKTRDFGRFDTAEENYERLKFHLLEECTPKVRLGASLA